jgi:glycosyltransferase involved in cell wall biosynthesis
MKKKKLKIALISPAKEGYSETFIKAQKDLLPYEIEYYYGGFLPTHHERQGKILKSNFRSRLSRKIRNENPNTSIQNALIARFKKNNIKCVLAQYGPTGAEMVDTCKKSKLPLIVHFHGYDASLFEIIEAYSEKYKKLFDYAAAIIAVSQFMYNALLQLGAPKEKLILNTYGPNEIFKNIQPDYKSQQLIAIGRFVDKKAPYYTILAFQQAIKNYPKAKLVMIGDGPLLATCKNLVKHFKLKDNVFFKGVQTPTQIKEEMSRSCAFIQHSIRAENGDCEGTPLSVLEAQLAGLPVISTYHAGIPDVVIHNETGLLSNEHDVKQMSQNIISLLHSTETLKQMGRCGRESVSNYFSMDRYIKKLTTVIDNSLK